MHSAPNEKSPNCIMGFAIHFKLKCLVMFVIIFTRKRKISFLEGYDVLPHCCHLGCGLFHPLCAKARRTSQDQTASGLRRIEQKKVLWWGPIFHLFVRGRRHRLGVRRRREDGGVFLFGGANYYLNTLIKLV